MKNKWTINPWNKNRWTDESSSSNNIIVDNEQGVNSVSAKGKEFIKSFEKLRLEVYDANGNGDWTIGWGHQIKKGENFDDGITTDEANKLFKKDLKYFENKINRYVKVPLSQQQYDALASYVFNVGVGNSLVGTKLIKCLNKGEYDKAMLEMDINTSGGVYMSGLENRRKKEQMIWEYGVYEMHD